MKTRIVSMVLALVLVLTALPIPAQAASGRLPIYLGHLQADYLAEQILQEIPTNGLSEKAQILAVYDWIIANCDRDQWDGQRHFDEAAVSAASQGEFATWCSNKVQKGQILIRRELKEESGTPPGAYDFTTFVMDSNYNVASYAYEILYKRQGNCAHFSALLALLLSHLGFDSRMIHGEFINMDGTVIEHTWNYVLVDGRYYWFDVRIDHALVTDYQIDDHEYFMVADTEAWAEEHNFDPEYSDWLAEHAQLLQDDFDQAYEDAVGPWSLCSDWAKDYMQQAGAAGLIPDNLDNQDLTLLISRAEFAAVAVRLYEALRSEVPRYGGENPFTDTEDPDVLRAYSLGVVNGMGDGTFAPDAGLTREQAVTMLGRVYELAYTDAIGDGSGLIQATARFADHWNIFDYAKNYVYFFSGQSIIDGMGDGTFAPKASMTREQAIKVAVETADKLG